MHKQLARDNNYQQASSARESRHNVVIPDIPNPDVQTLFNSEIYNSKYVHTSADHRGCNKCSACPTSCGFIDTTFEPTYDSKHFEFKASVPASMIASEKNYRKNIVLQLEEDENDQRDSIDDILHDNMNLGMHGGSNKQSQTKVLKINDPNNYKQNINRDIDSSEIPLYPTIYPYITRSGVDNQALHGSPTSRNQYHAQLPEIKYKIPQPKNNMSLADIREQLREDLRGKSSTQLPAGTIFTSESFTPERFNINFAKGKPSIHLSQEETRSLEQYLDNNLSMNIYQQSSVADRTEQFLDESFGNNCMRKRIGNEVIPDEPISEPIIKQPNIPEQFVPTRTIPNVTPISTSYYMKPQRKSVLSAIVDKITSFFSFSEPRYAIQPPYPSAPVLSRNGSVKDPDKESFNSPINQDADETYILDLKIRATAVCQFLQQNKSYNHWSSNWRMLEHNLARNRYLFERLDDTDADIAYVINKGDEVKFRIRDLKRYVPLNIYQYVLYHEMAHMSTTEIDHTPFFHELLNIISLAAFELGFIDLKRTTKDFYSTNGQPILCRASLKEEITEGCDLLSYQAPAKAQYYESIKKAIRRL